MRLGQSEHVLGGPAHAGDDVCRIAKALLVRGELVLIQEGMPPAWIHQQVKVQIDELIDVMLPGDGQSEIAVVVVHRARRSPSDAGSSEASTMYQRAYQCPER